MHLLKYNNNNNNNNKQRTVHSAGQLDGAQVLKQIILGNNLTNHALSMLRSQSTLPSISPA
jgi:hypothetical protein